VDAASSEPIAGACAGEYVAIDMVLLFLLFLGLVCFVLVAWLAPARVSPAFWCECMRVCMYVYVYMYDGLQTRVPIRYSGAISCACMHALLYAYVCMYACMMVCRHACLSAILVPYHVHACRR
jgi:hypothetical protein